MVVPLIDLLLKLIIAVSVTQLVHWPVFSIFVFNFAILFSIEFILYFSPYEDRIEQLRASFNTISYLFLNYHLFLFTNNTDASMFPLVSNSVIMFIWFCIGVNVMLTVPVQLFKAGKHLRNEFLKMR